MPPRSAVDRARLWIFDAEDARRLAAMRIGLCALLAVHLAATNYRSFASQPAALVEPLWYLRLFDHMPSPRLATGLQILGVLAALAAAAGIALRVSLATALTACLVLDGMLNSAGRVVVGDAVLVLCLLVLLASTSAAGEAWAARPPGRRRADRVAELPPDGEASHCGPRYGWPIRTAMAGVALSLFFSGLQKLRYSGLAWVTSDNLRWILYASSDSSAHPNATALFIAGRPWLAHLCAAGTLVFEIGFPVVLVRRRARWLFIPGVLAMHLAIRVALGLDYSMQALTLLVVFVDWPAVVTSLRKSGPSSTESRDCARDPAHGRVALGVGRISGSPDRERESTAAPAASSPGDHAGRTSSA